MSDKTVVLGLEELGARVNMFTNAIQKQVVRKASNAGAAVFQKEMRRLAPVRQDERPMGSKHRMPGYLKKHISRRGKPTRDGGFEIQIAPLKSAFYYRFIELGWHHHEGPMSEAPTTRAGRAAHAANPNIESQPFMRPAFDGKIKQAEDAFAATLKLDMEALLK
jgi:HK97 gp10 family phage protein